jgi:hypothetical protein
MGNLLAGDDAATRDAAPPSAPPSANAFAHAAAGANLPPGWEALYDDRGIIFYGHPESRITQ